MAENELSLINKVELRIALADTDAKLQASLDLYLAPLLLKLGSKHSAVRHQILKFIQSIIPRINSVPTLKLPVSKLLDQAKSPNLPEDSPDSKTVQLYSLLFVSKGIDRLDLQEKRQLIPAVLKDIHKSDNAIGARLFHTFTKLLKDWKTPDRGSDEFNKLKEELNLNVEDEVYISDKILNLFLLVPVVNNDGVIPRGYTCPGLSAADVSFLTYDAGVSYKGDDLSTTKQNVASFLPLLQDENIIIILLVGAVDSNEQVANSSANFQRKVKIPYENEILINRIISLFIGEKTIPRSPVKKTVQERFFQVLNKSIIATKSSSVPIITAIGLNATRFPKLKSAAIQFIQWTARHGADSLVSGDYSINVAAQLRNNLHSEGWPKFEVSQGTHYATEIKHRRSQYEALGEILKQDSSLLANLSYIEFLFDSLLGDVHEVRSTVQEVLGSLVVHLPQLTSDSKGKLKSLLKVYFQHDDLAEGDKDALQAVRYTSLKYLNTAFPFSDAEVRLLNVLATSSNNRSDVIEEARKGLHPYWFKILQSSNTSEFKSTDELLGAGQIVHFPSFESLYIELTNVIKVSENRDSSPLKTSFSTAAQFLLQTLVTHALKGKTTVVVQDQEWSTRLEKALDFDQKVISLTKDYLKNLPYLSEFIKILSKEFVADGNKGSITEKSIPLFGRIFLKLTSFAPQSIIADLIDHVDGLLKLVQNVKVVKDDIVLYAATSIGIIASHPSYDDDSVLNIFQTLIAELEDTANSLYISGRLLALSFLTSRLTLRGREGVISEIIILKLLGFVTDSLDSKDTKIADSAILSISELSKYGLFTTSPSSTIFGNHKSKIIEYLKQKTKKSSEKAVIALALLSLSDEPSISEDFTEYEAAIYETHNNKQVELSFTSGEAFSILAFGWDSKFLKQSVDVNQEFEIRVPSRSSRSQFILDKVLVAAKSSKPSLRTAACIWLLSLVQYNSNSDIIKNNAGVIHVTFMKFLADRDELVQEAASRGLSLVYDLGDNDLKEVLIKSLLKSFTDTTSSVKLSSGSVSENTELFEPGVLKTDDGSISTYKDILSLASEVGDPSLVYKFMSLAKSSALWSSRKGIAFGLGSIMSKSSLDKLLFENQSLSNRLIPKLFRYRFDPNQSVARSMNDIWSTIVPDSSKTIEKYHKEILIELLSSMGNKEWRVREASTIALIDLLQILKNENYQDQMEEIWTMGFRALDDIKESVRKAGGGLTRSLAQTLVNSINVESGSSEAKAQETLQQLIPFLLGNKGVLSDAEDVRNFSLDTILTLVKKSGKSLKPFIGELIEQFILLISTLEPQVINYLALNAEKYKLKSDDIDAKRIQSIGSSPMMNALEKLIDLVDENIIEEVIVRIESSIKKSVGLPSKAAASKVIVTLIIRHLQLVKPYGEKLLQLCSSQLKDRNSTVSSSYAAAAGYVCRICPYEAVVKYSDRITKIYFTSEDEKARIVAGIASESVAKYSNDKFASVASAFLPVAFVARNDPVKEVAQHFNNEWSENTSGKGAIKLYLSEICELVKNHINSSQFFIRQVAAKSIAKACNSLDKSSSVDAKITDELFEVLIDACKGRSWSGKEDVLAALVSLSIKSKSFLNDHDELLSKVKHIVIIEAKRRNKAYQKQALISLGAFLNEFPNAELYDEIIVIFSSILSEEYYESEDDDEESTDTKKIEKTVNIKSTKKNLTREAERIQALASLTTSFQLYQGEYHQDLLKFLLESLVNTIHPEVYIPTWRSQIAIADGLTKIASVLQKVDSISPGDDILLITTFEKVFKSNTQKDDLENVKIQTIRAAKALIDIKEDTVTSSVKSFVESFQNSELSSILEIEIKNALST